MTETNVSYCRFRLLFRRFSLVALLLGLTGICLWHSPAVARGGDDPPGAYKAESPEPTPAETLILEYINRCRSNPAEDALRCVQTPGVPGTVDYNLFKQEMFEAKPAPPLVFDLSLIKAARWHSYYQIINGQEHVEEEGKQGYTGKTPLPRAKLAGFDGEAIGENIFRTATRTLVLPCCFRYRLGERSRRNAARARPPSPVFSSPDFRVAGIGAVRWPSGEDFAVTEEFGAVNRRMLGGVVFNDRNRNALLRSGRRGRRRGHLHRHGSDQELEERGLCRRGAREQGPVYRGTGWCESTLVPCRTGRTTSSST